MLIKISGQPQMSFEQFEKAFRQALGRDMTSEERRWLRIPNFFNDSVEQRDPNGDDA